MSNAHESQALVVFDPYGSFELTGPELRTVAGGYETVSVPAGASVGPVGVHAPGAWFRYKWTPIWMVPGGPYPYPYNTACSVGTTQLNCPTGVTVNGHWLVGVQNPICGSNIGCGAPQVNPLCGAFGP